MLTPDAHSIMLLTEEKAALQARIAALQGEVEALRAAKAELEGATDRRDDLTARAAGRRAAPL